MSFKIAGKIITVIGAARSGIAVANTIIALGGKAQISEFKQRALIEKELQGLTSLDKVTIECGGHSKDFILRSSAIVLSPGVRMDIAPVKWAKEAGIEVMGEIEFAFRLCPCPIVAVTGSNGKTTTVTLITEIIKRSGKNAVLCGNIGSPFSKHVLTLKPDDIVVLEISSFQLETTSTFKPTIALWLNFSQNHLDRHKDLQEYFEAKKKIFANQDAKDVAVLNAAQEELVKVSKALKSKVVFFNGDHKPTGIENPNHMAALAVAKSLGISEDVCRSVFQSFKGVEHRLEPVREIDGVEYINDSKSTTTEAGRWALLNIKKPMVMICGGSDKHLDFSPLKDLVKQKVLTMVVYGQTKDILRQTFENVVPVVACDSLKDALTAARQHAKPGASVVLSPMCASFDMFNDYEHRGRVFKELVSQLN